ncbi:glycosyltransferase [Streptomyces iconiensis]|uniref:Glycosyltransferase n=1 Tax=Streptomyces iconiensis TaxID=1384038 RepID=A0ABT6ZZG8_9ACTN|nr:nucleotide disphospho-sugar-binding domain-containing protein [Streptomyces iconiensis]MDJ1134468.1 glycosyltransferase [Streptomyces iconiensis]
MTPGVLVVVPPTAGHVNHGIALAGVVGAAGCEPVLVTGTAAASHLERLRPGHPWHCLPSHDLERLDRSDPRRRPHLEQLCDPALVRPALRDERELADRYGAALVIGKDYFAAVLAAAARGIPYASYYTDGIESVLNATSRQTVSDPVALTRQLRAVAAEESIDVELAPVPETLRSPVLNIVRGFPRTAAVSPGAWQAYEPTVAFAGALTYDASPDELDRWTARLSGLEGPVHYATFGTVLRDRSRFTALTDAARLVPGTWLVADPGGDLTGALPRSVVAAPYVPNGAALARADVVIHHGGYGTTLSALLAGVPQLVVPDNPRTQQRTHGQVLRDLGVGRLLAAGDCSGEAVAESVTWLREPDVRGRAAHLAAELTAQSATYRAELRDRIARAVRG